MRTGLQIGRATFSGCRVSAEAFAESVYVTSFFYTLCLHVALPLLKETVVIAAPSLSLTVQISSSIRCNDRYCEQVRTLCLQCIA